jgi:CRP-like cAMP-binding protein
MSIKGIFPINNWDFNSESVLADLPEGDLKLLMLHQSRQLYKKGEIIFREGAYPSGIFFIVEGKVKKFKTDKYGKEHIIYVANRGELFGYHAILSEDRFPDSAAALEESLVAFIPREDFVNAVRQAVLANNLTLLAQKSVRERLALQLVIIREKYKVNFQPGMPVEINMGRDDLASLVGTARENVVRILSEFREEKILETKGRKIIITDVQKLIAIANG